MDEKSDLLNSIFLGEVANVHNYGAFVKVPGRQEQGMVHRSQLSSVPVDMATDVLQKGDRVWCKVIGITDDGKISLSMKVVQQGTGKDLDPTGVQMHQDEMKRKSQPSGSRRRKIELGAVLDTTCSKCGTRGHLSRDCFKTPDGKTYELIPDDDDDDDYEAQADRVAAANVEERIVMSKSSKKEKKKKKKSIKEKKKETPKKKKKKRKKSSSSSSSSSSESSDDEPSRKKRKRHDVKSKRSH